MTEYVWDQQLPTLREIKSKIPDYLFIPDHRRGFLLFTQTIVLCVLLYVFAIYAIPLLPSPYAEISWIFYWFFQGTVYWSLFGWGHDSGHGAFSRHAWINTLIGNIVHSFIFLPYESWRISHREHHRNTGNIDADINYAPKRDHRVVKKHFLIGLLGFAQLLYIVGISGSGINHLNPFHPVFRGNRRRVAISLFFWVISLSIFFYLIHLYGFLQMMAVHGVPVLGYGTWLILSSFLNHADPKVPWWGAETWNYMKGNIFSVIDISYGRFLDYLVQDNGLHQIHHLFPHVPTYHMKEATRHFRSAFPHLVKDREKGVLAGFVIYLINFARQREVPEDVDVFFYDGLSDSDYGSERAGVRKAL